MGGGGMSLLRFWRYAREWAMVGGPRDEVEMGDHVEVEIGEHDWVMANSGTISTARFQEVIDAIAIMERGPTTYGRIFDRESRDRESRGDPGVLVSDLLSTSGPYESEADDWLLNCWLEEYQL